MTVSPFLKLMGSEFKVGDPAATYLLKVWDVLNALPHPRSAWRPSIDDRGFIRVTTGIQDPLLFFGNMKTVALRGQFVGWSPCKSCKLYCSLCFSEHLLQKHGSFKYPTAHPLFHLLYHCLIFIGLSGSFFAEAWYAPVLFDQRNDPILILSSFQVLFFPPWMFVP